MSVCFQDDPRLLAEHAIQIALNYLQGSGEIDNYAETCECLMTTVGFMIRQGQRNKLLLANRAISAFQQHRNARTIEMSRASG
jgi:hypothetical protein